MYSSFSQRSPSVRSTPSLDYDGSSVADTVQSVEKPELFRRRWCFLTYAKCSLEEKDAFVSSFEGSLKDAKLDKATFYGCREKHKDGDVHYHVLVHLGAQKHWTMKSARRKFALDDNECESLNIVVPGKDQAINFFVKNHVNYVEKEGETFGERPVFPEDRQLATKRKWEEVSQASDSDSAWKKVMTEFPAEFFKSYNNIRSAINHLHADEDTLEAFEMESHVDQSKFRVPNEIAVWELENLVVPQPGRTQCLIIIGDTRSGKSTLAQFIASRYGKFSEFDTEWDMKAYRPGQKCAVFHDMQKGFRYWKGVFGCQPFITAYSRYERSKRLKWGVPSIWVCNYEDDPRIWSDAIRIYLEHNAVIYEVPRGYALYEGSRWPCVTTSSILSGGPSDSWGADPTFDGSDFVMV